jgi:hypothetical protein
VALVPFAGEADPALIRGAEALARDALSERRDSVATADEVTRGMRSLNLQALATTDQHLRLGRALNVEYVIAGRVTPLAGQYNLAVTVYQISDGRTEVLEEVVVPAAPEAEEVVAHMLERLLRPGGLGEDPEPQQPLQPPEPPRPPPEPPQEPPAKQAPAKRPPTPPRPAEPEPPLLSYTPDSPLGIRGGLGVGLLLGEKPVNRGPALAILRGQVAYMLLYKLGVEVRAGLDMTFGTAGSFSLLVGGGLAIPLIRGVPLYAGGGVDLGLFVNTSGGHGAFFQLKPSARAVYVIANRFEVGVEPIALTFLFGPDTHVVYEASAFFGVRLGL